MIRIIIAVALTVTFAAPSNAHEPLHHIFVHYNGVKERAFNGPARFTNGPSQAQRNRVRTVPLWGLRARGRF